MTAAEKLERKPPPATAEEMFLRCRPAVERAAFKFALPWIREDVIQEAFLRIVQHWRECRDNPQGWATGIVLNLVRHRHRDVKREDRFEEEEKADPHRFTTVREIRPPSAELLSLVDRTFFTLSPMQQEALRILIVHEIPEREAAGMMGISCGAYRALVHRARRMLEKRLRGTLRRNALLGELRRYYGA